MASPFTAYLAGMGTLAAVLALGLSTVVMLIEPSPSVQRRTETKTEESTKFALRYPLLAVDPPVAVSPVITAAQTPRISTHFAAPPALWAPPPSTTGQSSEERPALAADPGMLQIPVRPAVPVEAAAPGPDEWKKKEKKYVQKKQRRQIAEQQRPDAVVDARTARGYAAEQRRPPGIFDFLLGRN